MNFGRLREVLERLVVAGGVAHTHTTLVRYCSDLGLPAPINEGSKRERMESCFVVLEDGDLPEIAECLLQLHPPNAADRNLVQDLLWEDRFPPVAKRTRREVARAIDGVSFYLDARHFDSLLDALWVVDNDPLEMLLGSSSRSLRSQIDRHVYNNPGDWNAEMLFDQLGAFDCLDKRFTLFLEGLASSDVRPDEAEQRAFVAAVNPPLNGAGLELRETGSADGYPVFEVASLHAGVRGAAKNLIFASSEKPDLRFRDAVNNEIEIVKNADKLLVYDRPIVAAGLRWADLLEWWSAKEQITDPGEAKKSLYLRLRDSLPTNSPPQRKLFEAFYKGFSQEVPHLPVLLPEVWLHWDPQTAKRRGREALLRFRMDFLLLLPHSVRVVIEVDGKHHYCDGEGRGDVGRYAAMMHADRDLRLAGYEVFRFGAEELMSSEAEPMVKDFFQALFKRHAVRVSI
jgi:very-short-patch-repair endonuclease